MNKAYKGKKSSEEAFFGHSTIYGVEGEHKTAYMTRLWIGRLRLHIFYRGDNDPDPHNHPWAFWTFPLTAYVEEVFTPNRETFEAKTGEPSPRYNSHRRIVPALRLNYRPAHHTHRVIGRWSGARTIETRMGGWEVKLLPFVNNRKIVTIVWRGKKTNSWGFLKNRDGKWCWVGWKEYVFGGGKSAPCE